MKRVLYLLIMLPALVNAQVKDSATTTQHSRKFAIGINILGNYVYRTLSGGNSGTQFEQQFRDTSEMGMIRYSVGINVAYTLSKKIALSIGVIYSDREYKTHDNFIYMSNWTAGGPRPVLDKATFYFIHNYLDIPVKASYYFLTKRIKAYGSAGVSTNILLKDNALVKFNSGGSSTYNNLENESFNAVNLQAYLGLGVSYDISSRMYVSLEPDFMYSITSAESGALNDYFYSIGLNAGIYMRF
jgi:hypothetical protein